MRNLFIVPIEPIETRYTKHWFEFFPDMFATELGDQFDVYQIQAQLEVPKNTPGAFFNFEFTTKYKNHQMTIIADMFSDGTVQDNDVFLFTDYWNPCVIQLKYMAAMAKKKIKVIGICHAGLWDPADLLSQHFRDEPFGDATEEALYQSYDHLVFATDFALGLYSSYFGSNSPVHKGVSTGFPMEYYSEIVDEWTPYAPKEDIVLFPHRNAPEKHPEMFDELAALLPEYKFIKTLDVCNTKDEYHALMRRAKVCVSFADQETLGISMGLECLHFGCVPIVPDRLSYSEIFNESKFLYPLDATVTDIARVVKFSVENHSKRVIEIKEQRKRADNWFNGKRFYEFMKTV